LVIANGGERSGWQEGVNTAVRLFNIKYRKRSFFPLLHRANLIAAKGFYAKKESRFYDETKGF